MKVVVAYGVGLETDFPLEDLPPSSSSLPTISLEVVRVSKLPALDEGLTSSLTVGPRHVRIIRTDFGYSFIVDGLLNLQYVVATNRMVCSALDTARNDLLRYWILQRILPTCLTLDNQVALLHAAAIGIAPWEQKPDNDKAGSIAFYGPSHAGKSTLLSHFISMGHNLVTDDHLTLSIEKLSLLNDTEIVPAIPFYRPYRALEDLGVVAPNYSPDPVLLKRMYLLEPAAADADIQQESLHAMAAASSLLNDLTYKAEGAAESEFRFVVENRFRAFTHVARNVSVRRLHVPRDLARLPEVYRFIREDMASGGLC